MYQFVWPFNRAIHFKHVTGLRGFISDVSAITNCHSKTLTSSSTLRGLRTVYLPVRSLGPADAGFFLYKLRNTFWSLVFRIYPVDSIRLGAYPKNYLQTSNLIYIPTYLLHGSESLRSYLVCSESRNSPHFTEPEGSLPHSQATATCLYPGPAQSSPYTHIPLPGDPS